MNRSRALAAFLVAFACAAAGAQDHNGKDAAKGTLSQAQQGAAKSAKDDKPIDTHVTVGERDNALEQKILQEAVKLVSDNAKDIAHFVNDFGCVPNHGKNVPLNETALKRVAQAAAGNTEVVFNAAMGVAAMTGRQDAWAFGVPAEVRPVVVDSLKARFHAGTVTVGAFPRKNLVLIKVKPTGGGARFAHEFLHIVLRQLDNEALGGGKYKAKECAFVAGNHHQLTDYLAGLDPKAQPQNTDRGWSQFPQGQGQWTPSTDDPPACAPPDLSEAAKSCQN